MSLRLLCPTRRAWLLDDERAARDTLARSLALSSELAAAGAVERSAVQAACAVEAAEILCCRHRARDRESLGGFAEAVRLLRLAVEGQARSQSSSRSRRRRS